MKFAASFAALALLATVGLASTASARPGHGGRGGDHHARGPRIELFQQLGLDQKTLGTVQQILDGTKAQMEALHAEKKKVKGELKTLLEQPRPDQAKALAYVEALGNLQTEMQKARMTSRLQIQALLTPEQQAKLKEMRNDFRGKHGKKGKRGMKGARFEAVKAACSADVAKLCPDLEGREAFQCMKDKKDQVSTQCKDAFEAVKKGRKGGDAGQRHL